MYTRVPTTITNSPLLHGVPSAINNIPTTTDTNVPNFNPSQMTGIIDWWQADLGYSGAAWIGQKAGNDLAQATANQQGTSATDATLNNLTTLSLDGSNDNRRCTTIALPAPGTTPTYCYMLFKHVAWVSGDALHAGGASAFALQPSGVTPALVMSNPTSVNSNTGGTVGQWRRAEWYYSNSAADFTHIGTAVAQGAAAGNNAGSQITIGANNGLTAFAQMFIYFYGVFNQIPTLRDAIGLEGYLANLIGTTGPF